MVLQRASRDAQGRIAYFVTWPAGRAANTPAINRDEVNHWSAWLSYLQYGLPSAPAYGLVPHNPSDSLMVLRCAACSTDTRYGEISDTQACKQWKVQRTDSLCSSPSTPSRTLGKNRFRKSGCTQATSVSTSPRLANQSKLPACILSVLHHHGCSRASEVGKVKRAVDGLTIATTPPVTPLSYLQAGSMAVSAFLGQ